MKIVFLDEYTLDNADLSAIKALGDYVGYPETVSDQILERCQDAEIIITNKVPLDQDTIHSLPCLKLICVAATGMNNVDLCAAADAGIEVRNAIDYSTHSVAEHTFGSALALMRQLAYYDQYVKSGAYSSAHRIFDFGRPIHELYGKKWGIIGLGNIGRQVAKIATAFGCEVAYYSTSGHNQDATYPRKSLEELLSESDIISLHAPLNAATYHLLDFQQFSLMQPFAILVNVARGDLINEEALAQALNEERIGGAALDVYSQEPAPASNPLFTVKDPFRLIFTPHVAWASQEALQTLAQKVAENICNFQQVGTNQSQ